MVETEKYSPDSSEVMLSRIDENMLWESCFSISEMPRVADNNKWGCKHYHGPNSVEAGEKYYR